MIKKFIVVGALGAAAFGIAAASASALPVQTSNNNEGHGRVQQSDAITATCQTDPIQFTYVSAPQDATTNTLNVYGIDQACYGSAVGAVAYDVHGTVLGTTNVDRLDGNGHPYPYNSGFGDFLTFPTPVSIQDIDHTIITISDGLQ